MPSLKKRGNIHQRITFTPALCIFAMPLENAALPAVTPSLPHALMPPKSPPQWFQAQLVPTMKRFLHPQVTPALDVGHGSVHDPPEPPAPATPPVAPAPATPPAPPAPA